MECIGRWYGIGAVIFVNTLIAFAALNAVLYFWYPVALEDTNLQPNWYDEHRWLEKFSDSELGQVYPGLGRKEAEDLVRQTALLRNVYQPYVEFRPASISSKYMNVSDAGFRSVGSDQGPWPESRENINVFVFGGSTTFGPGVADRDTIAAHLQRQMRAAMAVAQVNAYNFGAGAYVSTQERIRFHELLVAGHRPDLAVFVDGLNDFILISGEPAHASFLRNATDTVNALVQRRDLPFNLEQTFLSLPIGRALRRREVQIGSMADFSDRIADPSFHDEKLIDAAIDRYLRNMRIIEASAATFGVRPLMVWQPIPFYKYPMEARSMAILGALPPGHEQALRPKYAYPVMRGRVDHNWPSQNFLWCADLQVGQTRLLYVDHVHYSGEMAGQVATCIVDRLRADGSLDRLKLRHLARQAAGTEQ